MKMNEEKELIYHLLQTMLKHHFKTKSNMAKVLRVELRTIQKTFSQMEKNYSKGGSIVLEKTLVYCAQNNISVDELMGECKKKEKGLTVRNRGNVDFPMPQGLDEYVMDVYYRANAYVQCVASHLCPHCERECHAIQGDKWLWNDCMVSRISMIMLSHILLVQDDEKEHKVTD